MENPLAVGVVGRELIKRFKDGDREPVWAESVGSLDLPSDVRHYLLTFSDGTEETHSVTFAPGFTSQIVDSERLS